MRIEESLDSEHREVAGLKNRRVVVPRRGGPEVLELVEEAIPQPGPGQVRVKVEAAGVSAFDLMVRSGWFPGFPRVPFTPGVDVVGVVDAVADSAAGVPAGQRVAALTADLGMGGYAEFVCLPTDQVVPVPPEVDPAQAVCLVANYLTAHRVLHQTARVQPGDRILVHGAAGGVGTALLELARLSELETYGTASRHNHELVAALGATPIDYQTADFVTRIRSLTGDGVDAVFDPIGGARQLWRSYRCLRTGGRLVWFGVAATARAGVKVIPISLLTRLGLALIPDRRRAPLAKEGDTAARRTTLAQLFDLLAAGDLDPLVAARLPLSEAAHAHELLHRGGHAGKVVLVTGE